MIAADTSTIVSFFVGDSGSDVEHLSEALDAKRLLLSPPVLSELLSAPNLPETHCSMLIALPQLEIVDGYWERVGALRASILQQGKKSRLADALIAQNCIDHDVALITRDRDFRHYESAGLKPIC